MGHEGARAVAGGGGVGYTDQIESRGEKEGKAAGKKVKWVSLKHLPRVEHFSVCYFFESPGQNSEVPLRYTRFTDKATEAHTR